MGKHFGELYRVCGIVTYKISPFEQKAFAGFFKKGIPNTFRRISENIFRVAPPFILTAIVYRQVEDMHAKSLRKNPDDYICDE